MATQTLVEEICPTKTQAWIKRGALLVDVREKEEVAELDFVAPKLMHIPLSEFEERYAEIPTNVPVVMVCRDGERSLRAAGFLHNQGYKHVVNMKKGLVRWVQKGFPTKGNTKGFVTNAATSCCS
jgi:rhodanese-related sulfurtransferase